VTNPAGDGLVQVLPAAPGIIELVLSRPDRLNALDARLVCDLHEALAAIATDRSCRVVVLRGAGRHFCAGADLAGHGVAPEIASLGAGLALENRTQSPRP
jgi:enoyl-CoA hydratase